MDRHGESPSESNHASYVARIGPCSTVEPAVAIKNMIERQVDLNSERSVLIMSYHLKCKTSIEAILSKSKRNPTRKEANEIQALRSLGRTGHELWAQAVAVSAEYSKAPSSIHGVESGINAITRKGLADRQVSPPRYIGPNLRCDCDISVAFPAQCGHDIANCDGAFVKEKWSERYHQGEELETSRITCHQVANPLEKEGEGMPLEKEGEGMRAFDIDDEGELYGDDSDIEVGLSQSNLQEEQELRVQTGTRSLTHGFVTETMKIVGNNIFKHPKKEMLLGMVIKINELTLQGFVTTKTLEETVLSYSSAFTHSRKGSQMFVENSSLQPATVPLGSKTGRPRGERMKGGHELSMSQGRATRTPSLMNSQICYALSVSLVS
jgi:hypothetical protein